MRAGKRDKLVVFMRPGAAGNDGYTRKPGTPAEIGSEYAEVIFGRGDERREAAQQKAVEVATFRVLANPLTRSVRTNDFIQFDGSDWDITGNAQFGRDGREITATRRK